MKRARRQKLIFIGLLSAFFFIVALNSFAITDYKLEMPLIQGQETASTPGQYIQMLYMYGLGLAGIVGLFSMVWGGIVYMVSGTSETRKTEGKKWMWGAVSGIVLLLFSYLIFFTLGGAQFLSLKEPQLNENISNISENGPSQLEMPLTGEETSTPGQYVRTFFIFGLGGVGIVALFVILYGGTLYLLSGGFSATMKTRGKEWIIAAVSGLALLLCAYLILSTINPQLVNWNLQSPGQISIGGEQTNVGSTDTPYQLEMPLNGQQAQTPNQYIKSFFIFGLGLVGLVALFAVVYGGLNYVLAGSSETRKTTGKEWIWAAVGGVALLLCSFLILSTINPQLVNWNLESLKKVSIGEEGQTNLGSQDNPYQLDMPLETLGQPAKTPSDYVRLLFFYGLGLVGVVALFSVIWGGLNYILAGSSETRKTEGKKWIFGAVAGIALLLCSYLILNTINSNFIALQNPKLDKIEIVPHMGLGYNLSNSEIKNLSSLASVNEYDGLIEQIGQTKGLNTESIQALKAIMRIESSGKAGAESPDGGVGLFQFSQKTGESYGVSDRTNPGQSINGATSMFLDLYNRFGQDINKAIAAWNCGPGKGGPNGGGVAAAIAKGGDNWQQFLPAGVNKYGVSYDTGAYLNKIISVKNQL